MLVMGGERVLRGLYTGASGMLVQQTVTDTLSNNLANANTPGYKKDVAAVRAFPALLLRRVGDGMAGGGFLGRASAEIGSLGTGSVVDGVFSHPTPGRLVATGNPLDLAVQGDAFFVVDTAQGPRYTRAGNFTRDPQGYLATQDGHHVMGAQGPILIPATNASVQIDDQGNVAIDGQQIDRLRLVNFPQPHELAKQGATLLAAGGQQPTEAPPGSYRIEQGMVEQSNVNVVQEMVELITATRAYEAGQKVIQAQDETLGRAVNDVGSLR